MLRPLLLALLLSACQPASRPAPTPRTPTVPPMNPVFTFEIPVRDLDRAQRFYEAVFGYDFVRDTVDGNAMAFFPYAAEGSGASGALVQGDSYVPSHDGTRVYFRCGDVAATLARAVAAGGRVLYPATDIGALGHVGEFEDSEGNRIALHQPR